MSDGGTMVRRGRALIIVSLIIAALIGAVVLFNVAMASTPHPDQGVLSRGELRQVLSGAVHEPPLQGDLAEACTGPTLYDTSGTVQDLSWLESTYGPVGWECAAVHPDAGYVFRLTELRASCGPSAIVVNVKDENGAPLSGRAVVRYWPGAPALPYYDPPASRWTDLGVVGWTGAAGDVGFGLGFGDYYFPPESGVTRIYVADYDGPSDLVKNLGMLGGTDHCTLFPVYWRIPKEDIVTPTPEPPTPGPETPVPVPEGEGWYRLEGVWIQLATPEP